MKIYKTTEGDMRFFEIGDRIRFTTNKKYGTITSIPKNIINGLFVQFDGDKEIYLCNALYLEYIQGGNMKDKTTDGYIPMQKTVPPMPEVKPPKPSMKTKDEILKNIKDVSEWSKRYNEIDDYMKGYVDALRWVLNKGEEK